MARILVTGSADGLGHATADTLLAQGHDVVVHVRNASRAAAVDDLMARGAELIVADLGHRDEVLAAADQLNGLEPIDAIVHNAGVNSGPDLMSVNVVAPYLFTALVDGPSRQVYLSSDMHTGGQPDLTPINGNGNGKHSSGTYSDSKLFVTGFALAVARLRPNVVSSAVNPGWVPTRMGGSGAPDDLTLGHRTQEWLAVSDDNEALTSGGYWYHQRRRDPHPAAQDLAFQDQVVASLAATTGVMFSAG